MRGAGRVVFAGIVLVIVGTLNIIYGIGALDGANAFVNDTRYVLTNLNTLGWVLIILGVIQLTGGFSLLAGRTFGRVIGIIGGSLGAIGALLSVGGNYPWWSLGVFALCVIVVHGILSTAKRTGSREPDLRIAGALAAAGLPRASSRGGDSSDLRLSGAFPGPRAGCHPALRRLARRQGLANGAPSAPTREDVPTQDRRSEPGLQCAAAGPRSTHRRISRWPSTAAEAGSCRTSALRPRTQIADLRPLVLGGRADRLTAAASFREPSEACLGRNAAGRNGLSQSVVVALVLVGVCLCERSQRTIEAVARAEIARRSRSRRRSGRAPSRAPGRRAPRTPSSPAGSSSRPEPSPCRPRAGACRSPGSRRRRP